MTQNSQINEQIKNRLYQHLCQIVRERDPYLGWENLILDQC
jgi:hypothetical protein